MRNPSLGLRLVSICSLTHKTSPLTISRTFSSTSGSGGSSVKFSSMRSQGCSYSTVASPSPRHRAEEPEGSEQPSLRQRSKTKDNEQMIQTKVQSKMVDGTMESWSWLNDFGPRFPIAGSQVKIIETPQQFYGVLLQKSRNATKRVAMASLYLGTGELEQELVTALKENLEERADLKVTFLLDFARGSRGKENSRTMLLPLIQKRSNQCQLFLYHTPTLRGARKKILPQRWNELVGLQHMKIYIFDNSILITGANLSKDYFTNRQDRYFLIENAPDLADFYNGLIQSVSQFSFQVNSNNSIALHSNWTIHPALDDRKRFVDEAKQVIVQYYEKCKSINQSQSESSQNTLQYDTWVFPLIQMGPFQVSYDEKATARLLESLDKGSRVKLATGYFNLTPNYIKTIIAVAGAHFQILMAHPKANGFLGAKFPAGGIPAAYTLLATRFFKEVKEAAQEHRIQMFEYIRPSWTFHAKGLWFYPNDDELPFVTLIGSPNFGYRSVYRDLETQLYIVTTNKSLRESLENEQQRLYSQSHPFSEDVFSQSDRIVPLWVHMVIRFFKNFF